VSQQFEEWVTLATPRSSNYGCGRFSWSSLDTRIPELQWGVLPGVYEHRAVASSNGFSRDEMCGPPASGTGWHPPSMWHHVLVAGLHPATEFFYRFGSNESGWSSERRFRTQPAPGSSAPTRIFALAGRRLRVLLVVCHQPSLSKATIHSLDMGKGELDESYEHWLQQPALQTVHQMVQRVEDAGALRSETSICSSLTEI